MVACFRILLLAWVALFYAPERSMVAGAIEVVTVVFASTTVSSPQEMGAEGQRERDDAPANETTSKTSELADDSFEGVDGETPLLAHVGKVPCPHTAEILGLLHATPLRSLAMSGNERPPRLG